MRNAIVVVWRLFIDGRIKTYLELFTYDGDYKIFIFLIGMAYVDGASL